MSMQPQKEDEEKQKGMLRCPPLTKSQKGLWPSIGAQIWRREEHRSKTQKQDPWLISDVHLRQV
jgi:hypothetical protein